jgi:aspartate carbamoyltransferase catalytic subunit
MRKLSVDHLHGIKFLNKADVDLIFDTALNFKEVINRPIKKVPTLRDITIANLFFENSTRTKISFELAQKRLGADVINFSSSSSSVKKGESLIDTVNNILAMKVDMIVLRHPNPGSSILLSKHTESCIINAGDGAHEHPTQALLDSFSIFEKIGDLKGKNILIVGDILHSRVALSNIYLLNLLGANVKISCPLSLVPKDIEKLNVSVEPDIQKALRWCDAVNVLRVQRERMIKSYFPDNREYSMLFGLDENKISSIKKDILILHPGPINRGVEITSDLVESNNSIILEQVENGVAIRMAIMYLLASKLNFSINE